MSRCDPAQPQMRAAGRPGARQQIQEGVAACRFGLRGAKRGRSRGMDRSVL